MGRPEASGSGTHEVDSRLAQPSSKQGAQPSGPILKRTNSVPARLPSHPLPRTEVQPVRKPITRAHPDTRPPRDFSSPPAESPKLFGIPLRTKKQVEQMNERRIRKGAERKAEAMKDMSDGTGYRFDNRSRFEYREVLRAYHPGYDTYSEEMKYKALLLWKNNPLYMAEVAQHRNEVNRIPNGATASRTMRPDEQVFLTHAFRDMRADFERHPFHIHGETALVGNAQGEVVEYKYTPALISHSTVSKGDKYSLHTHPPYGGPYQSSASAEDHRIAALNYLDFDNKMGTYVTNGKDVLHIQPHSTELVKLIPDAEVEKKLGKFPVAFALPKPQDPPYPFANHEAPGALKSGRLMPKGPPAE
jgi:hypothetical protein